MKKFSIPGIYQSNPYDLQSYSFKNSKVYAWTEGKFVIQLEMHSDSREEGHNSIWSPVYIIDQELIPVLTNRNQTPYDTVAICASDDNKEFFIPTYLPIGTRPLYLTVPGLQDAGHNDEPYKFGKPIGGNRSARSGDVAIIPGKLHSEEDSGLDIFLHDIEVKKSEIAVIRFDNQFFDVRVMKIARDPKGTVTSTAISQDGLTACILIGYVAEPWEVVLIDLD